MSFPALQTSQWEERADCFRFAVFRMTRRCYSSFNLPRGAMGQSVVCNCDIVGHTHLLFVFARQTRVDISSHHVHNNHKMKMATL